ncbi:MAG TPA: matrixin family metalloprotease [Drouetiella sp.]
MNSRLAKIVLCLCALCAASANYVSFAKDKSDTQTSDATRFTQLLNDGSADDAEKQIAKYLQSHGDDSAVRALHAEALYKLGRYHYAVDELKEAMKTRIDNPDDALLMGKIYQTMHRSKDAVQWYKKFISLNPRDSRVPQYETLQRVLQDAAKSNLEKHRKVQSQVGNYLAAVTRNAMMRWSSPDKIRVFIKDGSDVSGYRPEFEESLRQAFDEWSESTSGTVAFIMVPSPDSTDMTVTWSSDLHSPALKAEAGLANTSYGAHGLERADILLLTVDPFKEGPIGKNMLYNVCLHEIGHALGLEGHSPTEGDIMYPALGVQQGLSDRDINTVLALYSADLKSDKALSDKDEYGRPLPPSVMCERLTNAGSIAAMNGDFNGAIEKLQSALEINPKQDLAGKNIAVAANNLAIVPGTAPDEAMRLLHLALYWEPTNDAARTNLNSLLQSLGKDPKAFGARIECAEQCRAHNDIKGAIVEYTEALSLKSDTATKVKLDALKNASTHK